MPLIRQKNCKKQLTIKDKMEKCWVIVYIQWYCSVHCTHYCGSQMQLYWSGAPSTSLTATSCSNLGRNWNHKWDCRSICYNLILKIKYKLTFHSLIISPYHFLFKKNGMLVLPLIIFGTDGTCLSFSMLCPYVVRGRAWPR